MCRSDRNKIKEAIAEYEYYANGFGRMCGHSVKVTNLRPVKHGYFCTVTLIDGEAQTSERYEEVYYRRDTIQGIIKQLDRARATA